MSQSGNGGHTGTMSGCLKGGNYLSNVGYQSSPTYLALPDILRLSFPLNGQNLNAKQAQASDFHAFISQFVEEFEDVDTNVWPVHLRWRAINACLAGGLLKLLEVEDGFQLEVIELPEGQPEVQMEAESVQSEAESTSEQEGKAPV